MKNLSKSRYTLFRQCPKALWMTINKPEEAKDDPALQARFAKGNVIGDLAMEYLGPYEEVTAHKPDGGLDLVEMIRRTQDAMSRGVENIAEASFSWADKVTWIQRHLGKPFEKRLILSHHKDLLKGDYLIDDREKHGANTFPGKWIHFGSPEFPDWTAILKELNC